MTDRQVQPVRAASVDRSSDPSTALRSDQDRHETTNSLPGSPQHSRATLDTTLVTPHRWLEEGDVASIIYVDQPALVVLQADVESDGMPDLRFELHDAVAAGARHILVDTSGVDALPSGVIASMLTAHRACRRRGGHVAVCNPTRRTVNQLDRSGLSRVFKMMPTPTGARGGTAQGGTGVAP